MVRLRTLIICKSVHHQNTAKVAHVMAEVLQADMVAPEDATHEMVQDYNLLGLGSGIYFGRFHSALRKWVRSLPVEPSERRQAFVFSTSGLAFLWPAWHWPLKVQLGKRGVAVVAEFHCRGFDTVGPLWLLGGLNRQHPDQADLNNAAAFARALRDKLSIAG